jgi:S1-C subfamily serine protease
VEEKMGTWNELSDELSQAVQEVGKSIVTLEAEGGRTFSGILLEEQKLLTSASAAGDSAKLRAWLSPAQAVEASIVGSDPETDIALLRVEQKLGPAGTFAESPKLEVGQFVLAVGRTWRGNLVASSGILSGVMGEWHTFRGTKIEAFIRPDLNLYSGCTGGALINADRKIIGMNTGAMRRKSPLAMPYATIKRVTGLLSDKGYIPKPYLGLGLQPVHVSESLRKKLNLMEDVGALVVHVESASPADKAGFIPGDILLGVNEQKFGQQPTRSIVFRLTPNEEARVTGIRGGEHFSSTFLVGERRGRRA